MIDLEKLTSTTLFGTWRERINEIIDTLFSLDSSKANNNHASSENTYGIGTSSKFGHLKISDTIESNSKASDGVAPSLYAVKTIDTKLNNVNSALESKADKEHNHKNIVSSGNIPLIESGIAANEITGQIELEGCSVSEIYNDNNSPKQYGNILNVRGKNHIGGGQLFLEWSSKNNTTGSVLYRSHSDTSSNGWGPWVELLSNDNPDVTGTLTSQNITISNNLKTKNFSVTNEATFDNGLDINGELNSSGDIITSANIIGNRVYNAVWNDYAEFFPRGEETEAGDIIALDDTSEKEQYVKATKKSVLIVGTHSDTYGHIIGGEIPPKGKDFIKYNLIKYIPIGLAGRVNIKFKGKSKKGYPVTISDIAGVGELYNGTGTIIGYIVDDKNPTSEDIRLVKILLK